MSSLRKAITLIGPTASGKSGIAITLAKKYNGEIISCDSRQVYRGMNKGTGKVEKDHIPLSNNKISDIFLSEGIRHWMIDIIEPSTIYNVAKFQKKTNYIIADILKRGKIPILCGGTGLWAQAVVENMTFPTVLPDTNLRNKLISHTTEELFAKLVLLNPDQAKIIDPKNRHRLIRAIEIALQTTRDKGQEVGKSRKNFFHTPIDWIVIAINPKREILFKKIEKRLNNRLKDGMIDEVEKLHEEKRISWARFDSFGLEYRWISRYLRGLISYQEMHKKLLLDIRHYAKRQLTWLRRWERMGRKIYWINFQKEALTISKSFLKN